MKKNSKILLSAILIILFSLLIILQLNKKANPYSDVIYKVTPDSITTLTKKILLNQGFNVNKDLITVSIKSNSKFLNYPFNNTYYSNLPDSIKSDIPAYFYYVSVDRNNKLANLIIGGKEKILEAWWNQIKLSFTLDGNLIEYELNLDDSLKANPISYEIALNKAKTFLNNFTKFKVSDLDTNISVKNYPKKNKLTISLGNEGLKSKLIVDSQKVEKSNYQFQSKFSNTQIKDTINVVINVAGNYVTKFYLSSNKVDSFNDYKSPFLDELFSFLIYLVIVIGLVISAFKRYRAYEIGFKNSLFISLFGAIFVVINFGYNNVSSGWEFIIPITLAFIFSFGAYLIVAAVAESYIREMWSEKLFSIDLIINGYLLHNKIGKAIIRGISFSFALTSIYFVIIYLLKNTANFSFNLFKQELTFNSNFLTLIFPFAKSVNIILFPFLVLFLYLGTLIKGRIKSKYALIIIISIIWALTTHDITSTWFLGFIPQLIIGIFLSIIFYKYDVLTLLISLFLFFANTFIFWFALLPENFISYILVFYIALIIFAIFALFSKAYIEDLTKITPKFQKYITERQRMQSELAIAREVQMSFLPQNNPNFNGLEIAAKCIPAYEVGGDYYDFIKFPNQTYGIAIGDVSGKGTKAAFYMTLTKGFLKATARFSIKPAALLKDLNSMFFENAERGNFISMIFALFDIQNKRFTFARAGHTPIIYKSTNKNAAILKPGGIALGLEKGEIFSKTINEVSFNYDLGDYFVLFTDGVNEAENIKKEEFGIERITKIIDNNKYNTATELLELIVKNIKEFCGKAKQHDDMTLIVIKIVEAKD